MVGSAARCLGRLDRQATKASLLPSDVAVEVTRDYGRTASDKANELLFHLGLATLSIGVLIAVAIGWREKALVTLVVMSHHHSADPVRF